MQLNRFPHLGPEDELRFTMGVNALVGQPNTGKSQWLRMLDYLMGDPGKPEEAFDEDLVEKYESIQGILTIGNDQVIIERRWKQPGMRGKVLFNGEPILAEDLSARLLTMLEIPILHYPQGNPYSQRSWPELTWRSLLRHIYRRQRLWADIADKQPDSEQYACLTLFLGLAEHIFSHDLGDLVDKRKRLFQLEGGREQFAHMLDILAKQLIDDEHLRVGVTLESIEGAINAQRLRILELQGRRAQIGKSLLLGSENGSPDLHVGESQFENERIGEDWLRIQTEAEWNKTKLTRETRRLQELQSYRINVVAEIARLARAEFAGRVLTPLRVTICPVCNQSLEHLHNEPEHCRLCRQSLQFDDASLEANEERINLEEQQLKNELQEIDRLIADLTKELDEDLERQRSIQENAVYAEAQLHTIRQAVTAILPPELTLYDMDIGRAQEKVNQLERLRASLEIRSDLTLAIDALNAEIRSLDGQVDMQAAQANTEQAADALAAGMNSYLNALTARKERTWTQGSVSVKLRDRSFTIHVGGQKWSKLGGTMSLYFLVAYHYGLLSLSMKPDYHYPGLVILDLPPTFEGIVVSDQENFILEPFIAATAREDLLGTQVIVAGAAFDGLENVNHIRLTTVWKQ